MDISVWIILLFTGGYSWESLLYGAYEWTDPSSPDYTVIYDGDGGQGMFDHFIVDSHFRYEAIFLTYCSMYQ